MKYRLNFLSVEKEVEKKIGSFYQPVEEIENEFIGLLRKWNAAPEIQQDLEKCLSFAISIKSKDKNHPSDSLYAIHAIRVANYVLSNMETMDIDVVKTSMIHNYYEISGNNENSLKEKGFSKFSIEGIKLLTVDRERQFDKEYLENYYQNIQAYSSRLSYIRCMDKIDNLFAFQVVEDEDIHKKYIDNCEEYVVPVADRIFPRLGSYMREVICHMRKIGADSKIAGDYQKLLLKSN